MESRKQAILRAVVHEFTTSAVPVGSQALQSRYFVNLSSATIRSELAELAEAGYLAQPHTSAGRIPTDHGYRYFVDFLMDLEAVPESVRTYIRDELVKAPSDVQGLVEKVAMTAAAVTQNAAVASAPQGSQARMNHVDVVSLEPTEVLLILLLDGNLLPQQVAVEQKDEEHLCRLQRHDVDVVHARLRSLRGARHRRVLRDRGGGHRDLLDQTLHVRRRLHQLVVDVRPHGFGHGLQVHEEVDEVPVAVVGRDAAGRGVGLREVPGLRELGQLAPDRGRGQVHEVAALQRLRPDRHRARGELVHDRPENRLLTGLHGRLRVPPGRSGCADPCPGEWA